MHLLLLCLLLAAAPLVAAAAPLQIMPLGDSITKGAVDPAPSFSGYRARLFDLLQEAKTDYLFVGATDTNSNDAMKTAGQQFHNGYGSWRIDGLLANFEANQPQRGDSSVGGYFMVGGTGALRQPVFPDLVLLLAGTNDLGAGANQSVLESRMTALLAWFQKNRPKSRVFVATVPPRGPSRGDFAPYNVRVDAFNAWLAKKIPSLGPGSSSWTCIPSSWTPPARSKTTNPQTASFSPTASTPRTTPTSPWVTGGSRPSNPSSCRPADRLPNGSGDKRQTYLARMEFNRDGSIQPVNPLVPAFHPGSPGEVIKLVAPLKRS